MQRQRVGLVHIRRCLRGRGISTAALARLGKRQCAAVGRGDTTWEAEQRKPNGYWGEASNRRSFLHALAKRLGIRSEDDWAFVTKRDLCSAGGRSLLERHGGSLEELIKGELEIVVEARKGVPSGYWEVEGHRLALLRELAVKYAVERADDWRRVSATAVRRCRGGAALLQRYHGSWAMTLMDNLEDDRDTLQRMAEEGALGRRWSRRGEWECPEKRRKFAAALGDTLGITSAEQWRTVTAADIRSHGGSGWLGYYGGSTANAVREIIEGDSVALHQARPWLPRGHWLAKENIFAFIHSAEEALGIQEPLGWTRVGWRQLKELPGGRSFLRHVSLVYALRLTHPAVEWNESDLKSAGKKASQHHMATLVHCMFPGTTVVEDHRHVMLDRGRSGPLLELDVFLPERNLAFEYNGPQHYEEIPFFGPLEAIQARDSRKQELCRSAGIRLVNVPYWWDMQIASLAATVEHAFPGALAGEAAKM